MAQEPATTEVGIERPVIVFSAPRSGSTLLFETLARAPGVFTVGGESHRIIEAVPSLHPASRDYASNRLDAGDATDEVVAAVRARFRAELRDRDGQSPMPGQASRLLEKTPKNILRVPFMRKVFPDARYVVLFRDPAAVLSSMIEAWRSGHFVTYPQLPGWQGPPWSLLLVPGWQRVSGRPLEEVVAYQWGRAMHVLLEDLEALPAASWTPVRYERLVADPQAEITRLCAWLELDWDVELRQLPLSRFTVSAPQPGKWRRNEGPIRRVLPLLEGIQARVQALLARRAEADVAAR
jgi:hypothetical protein